MKKIFFIPMILSVVIISCSDDTIFGSGDLNSEIREVDHFTRVKSEGIFEIEIRQGSAQSVEITADNNFMSHIKTMVVDKELRLSLDDRNYRELSVKVHIVVTRFIGIKNFGVGDIYAFDIEEAGSFNVLNSGTANIFIEGSADKIEIVNEGSGNFNGFDFITNNGGIKNTGSGDIEINCAKELDVKIKGSGNVYYRGNPNIDILVEGSGNLIHYNE